MRLWPLLAVLALGACMSSGEPSESEIRSALLQAGVQGGAKAVKLACKSVEDRSGYVCDYRAPACNRFTGKCSSPRPFSGRFVRSGGRLQYVEDLTQRPAPAASPSVAAGQNQPKADPSYTPVPTTSGPPPPPFPTYTPVPGDKAKGEDVTDPSPAWTDDRHGPPPTMSPRDVRAIARWMGLNARCKIGDDSNEESREACEKRDDLARRMRGRGLCYGVDDADDSMAKWSRCE